ncbi:VIR protein [Plasmodium vivax]|uniref:VIR protein n=1 Tax=Plasmodium vivax TaxID=5855 RepID=A0A1G4E1S2_PLAVI|nr:VIR protein [Plasmodium vivax]
MLGENKESWKVFHKSALSFSGELNSEKFYKQLDDIHGFSKYFNECQSLTDLPNGVLVKKYCARLLKYLETDLFSRNNDNEYDTCILLNYWLYNRLNVILQSSNPSYTYQAFGRIGNIWSSFIEDNLNDVEKETCKHMHNIVNHYDWRKRKGLYDYCVNIDALKEIVLRYPRICNDVHEYIEDKAHLYEHFKKQCTPGNENICPKFYEKCKHYDPKDVLPLLSCHERIIRERPATVPRPQITDERGSGKEALKDFPSPDMRSASAQNLSENSYAVGKFGDVFLGVVATTMTAGGLYKFTPVGRMLRNGFGWNNSNMSNLNGVDHGLYGYASEAFNPYSGEEHYIGYHQA